MLKMLLYSIGGLFALVVLGFVILAVLAAHTSPTPTTKTEATKPPDAKESAPSAGFWKFSTETNAVDGAVTHLAYLEFPETVSGEGNNSFWLRCGKKTEASIRPWATNGFAQLEVQDYDSNTQRVRFRVDDRKPVVQSWDVSTNFHALFMPLSAVRSMRKGNVLVIEFSPSFERPTTATLPIAGIDEAIKQAGCKI